MRKSLRTLYEVLRFKAQERFMFEVYCIKTFHITWVVCERCYGNWHFFMAKGSLLNERNVSLAF